jgi:hypothetical protein
MPGLACIALAFARAVRFRAQQHFLTEFTMAWSPDKTEVNSWNEWIRCGM